MTAAVATVPPPVGRDATAIEVLERVIATGDLAVLSPQERVALYARTCESLGLNALTRPFEYITLNGKLTLYVRKDATDQLRRIYRVSIDNLRSERDADLGLLTVTADGHTPDGRREQSNGVVFIKGLGGEALANAVMKAETKAKRRLTLSLVGLGFLDESEVESVGGQTATVDPETGEIHQPAPRSVNLLDAVQAQQARMAPPAAPETVEGEVVAETVTPAAGEAPAAVCGDESPFTPGQTCVQQPGHAGNHRAANRESWNPR